MKKYILCAIGLTAFNISLYANTPTTDTTNNTSFFNQISIEEDGSFKTPEGVKGKIVCEQQKMQELIKQAEEKPDEFARCISVESFDITQDVDGKPIRVIFDGAFNFPHFTKKTTVQIIDEGNTIGEIYNDASQNNISEQQAKDLEHYIFKTAKITFHDDNDTITFETINKNNNLISELTIQAKNISGLIESGYKFSKTQQPNELINHLKNIEITKLLGYTPQQKKDSVFSGSINLLLAKMTNDSYFSMYNFNEKNVINLKSIKDGFSFDALYPISEKKLTSFDLIIKSTALKQIQEQLLQAQGINDYMGMFMSISMGVINPIPQEILIRNFIVTDLNGINILESKELSINPQTQTINGEIKFINSPNEYMTAQINGDTVMLTDLQGQTEQLSLNQFASKTEEFWNTPRATEFKTAFLTEIEKLRQTEPKTSVTHFYEGLIVGIEKAQARYQANEVIDLANKLAALSFAQDQISLARTGKSADISSMTLKQFGLLSSNDLPNGGTLDVISIDSNSVTMTITFPSSAICEAGADILSQGISCNGTILSGVKFNQK